MERNHDPQREDTWGSESAVYVWLNGRQEQTAGPGGQMKKSGTLERYERILSKGSLAPPPLFDPHVFICLMPSSLPAWQGLLWGERWRAPYRSLRLPWLGTASPSSVWASTEARTAPPSCTSSTPLCRGELRPCREDPERDLPRVLVPHPEEQGGKGVSGWGLGGRWP